MPSASTARERLLYAHRGASAHEPENTLPAFERALKDGAHVLELDVRLTNDDVVVVSHDGVGLRAANTPTAIAEQPWSVVQGWDVGWGFQAEDGSRPFAGRGYRMPRFIDVLQAFPQARFNVDLKEKTPALAAGVVAALEASQAGARVRLGGFHHANLTRLRGLGYQGPTGLSSRGAYWMVFSPRIFQRGRPETEPDSALQIPPSHGRIRLDGKRLIDKAHSLGVRVDYWVINDMEQGRRLLDLGADGLMSDDPALLAPLFQGA